MTINIITTTVNFRNIKFRPEEFQEILLDKEIIIIFLYFLSEYTLLVEAPYGEEGCICSTEQEEEVDSAENSFKKIRCRPSFFAELNEVLTRELAEDGYSW
ncbi:hypothetical protein P8452_75651 [Trifolium repens]|nr:hypothetical protein P8452_75651 [Trifolium repens]